MDKPPPHETALALSQLIPSHLNKSRSGGSLLIVLMPFLSLHKGAHRLSWGSFAHSNRLTDLIWGEPHITHVSQESHQHSHYTSNNYLKPNGSRPAPKAGRCDTRQVVSSRAIGQAPFSHKAESANHSVQGRRHKAATDSRQAVPGHTSGQAPFSHKANPVIAFTTIGAGDGHTHHRERETPNNRGLSTPATPAYPGLPTHPGYSVPPPPPSLVNRMYLPGKVLVLPGSENSHQSVGATPTGSSQLSPAARVAGKDGQSASETGPQTGQASRLEQGYPANSIAGLPITPAGNPPANAVDHTKRSTPGASETNPFGGMIEQAIIGRALAYRPFFINAARYGRLSPARQTSKRPAPQQVPGLMGLLNGKQSAGYPAAIVAGLKGSNATEPLPGQTTVLNPLLPPGFSQPSENQGHAITVHARRRDPGDAFNTDPGRRDFSLITISKPASIRLLDRCPPAKHPGPFRSDAPANPGPRPAAQWGAEKGSAMPPTDLPQKKVQGPMPAVRSETAMTRQHSFTEKIERVVEQKLNAAMARSSHDKPDLHTIRRELKTELRPERLINDEMIRVLLKKLQQTVREERFRMGLLS